MVVTVEKRKTVAVVTIDNPPVNATSVAVRRGLMSALSEIGGDATIEAAVLRCAGRTFVAGADVAEFGKPPMPPHLPDVLFAFEQSEKPWVAAIHGTALGGGLELAMACHGRVAANSAKLGLPEVTLGLIPGAGGTVRLPRLIPADRAVGMIAGGKPIDAQSASEIGLVDAVSDEKDLLDAAMAQALRLAGNGFVATTNRDLRPFDQDAFDREAEKVLSRVRGQRAPEDAVNAVRDALTLSVGDALAAERELFLRLKEGPQSTALRYIFFAERGTLKSERMKRVEPSTIAKVGIVGGGTMGTGIAAACLLAGLSVALVERDEKAADAAKTRVADILAGSLKRGIINDAKLAEVMGAFEVARSLTSVGDADLVIEAVFENMSVKKALFRDLDSITRPEAILATNTSYLDVNEIAGVLADPSRGIGLHFFSPAHIMKLLEIVVPGTVSDAMLATSASFAKRLGKIAVFSGVCDGFIGNRIMSRYRREAEAMLSEGALPWDIDRAMTDFGFPMGVFAMADLAGLDIAKARRDAKGEAGHVADPLIEAGRLGRKTGRGWYLYDDAGRASPDPWVEEQLRARFGSGAGPAPETIMPRILSAMQDEGQRLLDEGIAERPEDVDVVMVHGYGFPRHRGGPMFLARQSA